MDFSFRFDVIILMSFCYACKEFRAQPTFGMGRVRTRVSHIQKLPFYDSFWQLTAQNEVEGLYCLQTRSERWGSYGLGMMAA